MPTIYHEQSSDTDESDTKRRKIEENLDNIIEKIRIKKDWPW